MTTTSAAARRLWQVLLFVCAGLWVGWQITMPSRLLLGTWLFAAGSAFAGARYRKPILFLPAVLLAGVVMASPRTSRDAALQGMAVGHPGCDIKGVVTEQSGLGTFARVGRAECEGFHSVVRPGTVVVDDARFRLGHRFEASGRIAPLSDDSFDTARARLSADAVFFPEDVTSRPPRGLARLPSSFRESISAAASRLEPTTAALLLGLTIGDTSEFDEETLEYFRRSGLAHLLAVSGSNVAIIVGTVGLCVARTGWRTRFLSCGGALAFYVMVVGPDPSVVRAAAMGAVGLAGMVWGHRPEALGSLALALLVALALRPAFLFSVGLHLSAAATAGLVLWSRPLAYLLGFRMPRWVAWPLGATLAAQLAVAPLLALTFEEISVIAPLANLAAVPAVAGATILGLAAGAAGMVSDTAGSLAGLAASVPAAWIARCAEVFGRPSWAQVPVGPGYGTAGLILIGAAGLWAARGARKVN